MCGALPGESTREVLLLEPYQAALTPRELGGRLRLGHGLCLGWSWLGFVKLTPPRASGAGAARRVNLLILVITAQNAALGRQGAKHASYGRF